MAVDIRNKIWLGFVVACLLLAPLTVQAASTANEMAVYPGVTVSPDGSGQAWTTDYGDRTDEQLPDGYTIDMHKESAIRELNPGEHYYDTEAEGSVTIGKWVVKHTPGQCIHDTPTRDSFAGFTFSNAICYTHYNNGWFAYCADCGKEVAYMLIYGKSSTMEQITSMPASSIYVYICPYCNHLEQGHNYQHVCKGISQNRYRVTYRPNDPSDSVVGGYMSPTKHMFDNADSYNGEAASQTGYTDTALRISSYVCEGYIFTGWNTKADGSGDSFADGEEILNLTSEDNGVVRLYAQWKKCESTLVLDAGGGTYRGQAVYEQKQKSGTSYVVEEHHIQPPAGYQVTFQTNGGSTVAAITTTKSFAYWEEAADFKSTFKDNVYTFGTINGTRDVLTARYINNGFRLPDSTKSNVSLVGWYEEPGLTDDSFVGKPGDVITVDQNTVLYAKWANLTLWAYDDYESHGGVGAVDLTWEQKDGKSKYYKVYQSIDKATWKEIHTGSDIGSSISISESYGTGHQGSTYTVVHTGYYTLTANGAKGADYNSARTGGNGGRVTATYWLRQGDVLTFYAGSAGNGRTGGSNGNGADGGDSSVTTGRGGGAGTEIYLTRNGSKSLLLIAGGGAGANEYASGGAGGEKQTEPGTKSGADSAYGGGGGGGAQGGAAGEHITHTHQGSSAGGGCYGEPVRHYCSDSCYDVSESYGWFTDEYWDGDDYIAEWCCAVCGSRSGEYHFHSTTNPDGSVTIHCSGVGEPGYICCTEEHVDHVCGYNDGQILYYNLSCQYKHLPSGAVISSKAANGGSNYINTGYGCKNQSSSAGSNHGNGSISVVSVDVGYKEQNALADVLAKDKAAPGNISEYNMFLRDESTYRVFVTDPMDFGTVYYHKAESYEEGSIIKLATSNTTENTLVSGIQGYRYYVSANATGTVTSNHYWTEERRFDIAVADYDRYLHVAAVDVAGNIGPTLSVTIPKDMRDVELDEEYFDAVPLVTEMVSLKDSEYVYQASTGTYFVKADGVTEHRLSIAGYVDGKATDQYQPDWLQMNVESDSSEWYRVKIPRLKVDAGNRTFLNDELVSNASGEELYCLVPTSGEAERKDNAGYTKLLQMFTVDAIHDGKAIFVYPRVMSMYQEKEYWSLETMDKSHGITLIPDAVAPVINGIEALEQAGNLDMTEESKSFTITAADNGSGIRNLTVTITNQDNYLTRTYTSDSGTITVTVSKEDYLFLGDFVVSAEAVDKVGNRTNEGSDKLAFTLDAELKKAREPQEEDFKAGDGAVLTVTTGGYADKVIIRFQEELLLLNPELDKEYVYDFPEAIQTEVYEFNIPLKTLPGTYIIEVEAWKHGRKITEELKLTVRTNGSITEELRTRIRDNGV